jgi:potassium-transporting ATPase KdpC subunit
MGRTLAIALRTTAFTLLLTGAAYPLAVTALAHILFPWQAAGSWVRDERGAVVGSRHIGQPFTSAHYFQPRPSAAGSGYDGAASAGSNLGPTSARLRDRARAEARRLRETHPQAGGPGVPAELVTASASGLDPHLSPETAHWQVPRVAAARGVEPERIRAIVDALVEGRDLGFLGEPRVNVLLLNLALDRQFGRASGPGREDG